MNMILPSSIVLSFSSLCPSEQLELAKKAQHARTSPNFCKSLWQECPACCIHEDLQGTTVCQGQLFQEYSVQTSVILERVIGRRCLQELKGQSLDLLQLAGRQPQSPAFLGATVFQERYLPPHFFFNDRQLGLRRDQVGCWKNFCTKNDYFWD
jgi:hypothetical protein